MTDHARIVREALREARDWFMRTGREFAPGRMTAATDALASLESALAAARKTLEAWDAVDYTHRCPVCQTAWSGRECHTMLRTARASCLCGYSATLRQLLDQAMGAAPAEAPEEATR